MWGAGGEAAQDHGLVPPYLNGMAALHLHVHRHPGAQLANLKTRVAAGIQQATKLGLSENVSDKTDALLEMAKSA